MRSLHGGWHCSSVIRACAKRQVRTSTWSCHQDVFVFWRDVRLSEQLGNRPFDANISDTKRSRRAKFPEWKRRSHARFVGRFLSINPGRGLATCVPITEL